MKKTILTLTILSLYVFSFSQTVENIDISKISYIYDYVYKTDSLNPYTESNLEMILQVGEKYSKFTSKNKLTIDSLIQTVEKLEDNEAFTKLVPYLQRYNTPSICKYDIIKNQTNNKQITLYGFFGKGSYKVNDMRKINWKINYNKDTVISGHKCKKATTKFAGRNYTAWYTLNIPISEGPYKFSGLPGLIVQISDNKKEHIFTLVKSTKPYKNQTIFFTKTNYIETTPKNYVKAYSAYYNDLFSRVSRDEITTFKNEDDKIAALNRIAAKNNFIERY